MSWFSRDKSIDNNSQKELFPELLVGLNDNQKEAVTSTEGYVRIIAGAGSGKTKTLANRYAYIVKALGISPSNILCVTFTNKAAQEMKNRVRKLLNSGAINDLICTYHGFCVRVLREDIHKLSYPSGFTILDTEDQKSILKEIYEELGLKQADITYKKVLEHIFWLKGWTPYIECLIDVANQEKQREYIQEYVGVDLENPKWENLGQLSSIIAVKYILKQKKDFALDFEDLILFVLYIFHKYPDVLAKWQNRLDYIMVDETQDNSGTQWGLVELLQGIHKNLFVVGDPDQCIYSWRGANPKGLVNFDSKYKPCKTVILNQNYRSTPDILNVANSIIKNNTGRIEKDLFTTKANNLKVLHFHGKNEFEEGEWIAKTCIKKLNEGYKLSDIAILYRATHTSRFVEQAMLKHKLPYVIYGGIRFFERKEIKDTLAYLRMLDKADDYSFKRVINTPSRKLGKVFTDNLKTLAESENATMFETLQKYVDDSRFNRPGAHDFIALINDLKGKIHELSVSDLTQEVLTKSGLMDAIRTDGDQDRINNLEELMGSMRLYEKDNEHEEDASLTKYLQDIALFTNLDYKEETDHIKLMTIHQAKGLEFPVVFVIGMYEGTFPNHRSIREMKERGLQEERRLAYVAITRAEQELFLTESEGFNFINNSQKYPSRFIFEIKKNLLVRDGVLSKEMEKESKEYIQSINEEIFSDGIAIPIDTKVNHSVFGEGTVTDVDEISDSLTVTFSNGTSRHFSLKQSFKILERVSGEINEVARQKMAKQIAKENKEFKAMLLASGIDPQSDIFKSMLNAAGIDSNK
jgi:DNA helicase-2/ATP-dependent DNA helicase PcrA